MPKFSEKVKSNRNKMNLILLRRPMTVPATEWSEDFLQAMINRMGTSYFKYGPAAEAYPQKVDALRSLLVRLKNYQRDGNTEWLVDAANFAMLEFMHPSHKNAHFIATSSKESPGRYWKRSRTSTSNKNSN